MNKRLLIDISMTVMMPLLMAYSLIGETFHEIAGTLMLALFILHHVLNRKWFRTLAKEDYSAAHILSIVIDLMLLVFMIVQPLSGIVLSKHLYTFLGIPGISAARLIHLCMAYWGFVLMSFHAGMHITPLVKMIGANKSKGKFFMALIAVISVYGAFAFVKRGFAGYMFLKQQFAFYDFSESVMLFILDYIAVMLLFMAAGCLMMFMLQKRRCDY